jgi:nicotinic acid phosphoribosyltransferase
MAKTFRGPYKSYLSRISGHLDWYLRKTYTRTGQDKLSIADIQRYLKTLTNVRFRKKTILKYNAEKFYSHQKAPLEWTGDNNYRLNQSYYQLMKDKVFEPRIGIRGPPKKFTKGEQALDYQI